MARNVFIMGEGQVLTSVASTNGCPAIALAHVPEGVEGKNGDPADEHAEVIQQDGTFIVLPTLQAAQDFLQLIERAVRVAQKQMEEGEGQESDE